MENLKIVSLNCQSLRGKMNHIREDEIILRSHVICLSETWLVSDEINENIKIKGYDLKANGVGKGKGIAQISFNIVQI